LIIYYVFAIRSKSSSYFETLLIISLQRSVDDVLILTVLLP